MHMVEKIPDPVKDVAEQRQDGEKLGLRSMRQRVQAMQGDLVISSSPGEGTVIEFWCPIRAPKEVDAQQIIENVAV